MTLFTFEQFVELLCRALACVELEYVANEIRRVGSRYDLIGDAGLDSLEILDLGADFELILRRQPSFGLNFHLPQEVIEGTVNIGQLYEKLCGMRGIKPVYST